MLEESLRYPLNSDDRVATLIIGGLLVGLPFVASMLSVFLGPLAFLLVILTIPLALVVQGYLLSVLRSSAAGESAAPSFTGWGGLFVGGLKLLVVNLVVGLVVAVPFVVLILVFLGGAVAMGETPTNVGVAALGVVGVVLFGLAILFALLVSYLLPAMFTNFAVEGNLGAAFDLSTVRSVAFTSDYFVGVLLGVLLGSVINTVAAPLSFILVGLPLLFYGQVVTYYLFGRAYAEGRVAAGLPPVTGTPDPSAVRTTERSDGV